MWRRYPFALAVAAAVVGVASCTRGPTSTPPPGDLLDAAGTISLPEWPRFPATASDVRSVIASSVVSSGAPSVAHDAVAVEHASLDVARARAGHDEIAAWLAEWLASDGRAAFVVFGGTHDSVLQLDTFRAIVSRTPSLWAIGLEQFHASGAWRDSNVAESGDDRDLEAFFADASRERLTVLRDRQEEGDYAAWKFGYVPRVIDTVVSARGVGVPTFGCDMPAALRAALPKDVDEEALSRLREVHMALSASTALARLVPRHLPPGFAADDDPPEPRAALFVGANHAEAGALPSFLPKGARVMRVFFAGGRDAGFSEPATETGSLVALDPLLLRVDDSDAILVVPDAPRLAVTRVRDRAPLPAGPSPKLAARTMFVSSEMEATFEVDETRVRVGARGEWLSVRGGHHAFALRTKDGTIMGDLRVPPSGWAELRLSPSGLSVSEHEP